MKKQLVILKEKFLSLIRIIYGRGGMIIVCLGLIGAGIGVFRVMSAPLVSVVMCVYNGEKSGDLHRSIPSILNQTWRDFEFILIDDGSTDGSWTVLQEYARRDKRIRLLRNPENKGISYSRNRGNDAARGKYIMVMDQDDVSLPNRLLKQAAFMEARPWLDVVATPSVTPAFWSNVYGDDEIKFLLFFNNNYGHPNLMMRRRFLVQNKIRYNPAYLCSNDYDVLVQIRDKGGRFGTMYEALFQYNGQNYSKGKDSPCVEESPRIMRQWAAGIKADTFESFACQVADRLIQTPKYRVLFTPGFLEYKRQAWCTVAGRK